MFGRKKIVVEGGERDKWLARKGGQGEKKKGCERGPKL